jgi:succinate dehydrogenase/fumarate reductase flavoprotein subunit
MASDDIRYGGFKVASHFDRGEHDFSPREVQGARSAESAVTAALDAERAKLSRATVALLDIRAEIEDHLEDEDDQRVREVLGALDRLVEDTVEILN